MRAQKGKSVSEVITDDNTPFFGSKLSVLLLLVNVVMQKLDNQVDMGQDHASAAVSLATKLVQGLPLHRNVTE